MFDTFAWVFVAICIFGLALNGAALLWPNAIDKRRQAILNLVAELALMGWGVLLLMNVGKL